MSDEEDTTILLSEKRQDNNKLGPKFVICQPVRVPCQNVAVVTSRTLLLTSLVAALGGLSFGYDVGIGTNMVQLIRETFDLTCTKQEVITSVWLIGAVFASFIGGIIIDGCGRRWAISCSALLLIVGSTMSALADSLPLLLCGRLLAGFACALSIVSQCIYAAEVSDARSRGCAVMLYQLGIAVGLLLSGIAGTEDSVQWQTVIWLSAIPALLQVLTISFSPEIKLHHNSACGNLSETLRLALLLVILQQLCGRSAVVHYAPRVFVLVGVCPDSTFIVTPLILSIIKVGAVSLSLCTVDRIGRRACLLVGATCMLTSIMLLGLASSLEETDSLPRLEPYDRVPPENIHYTAGRPTPFPLLPTPVSLIAQDMSVHTPLLPLLRYVALFAVICFEIAFSFGLAPITWLLLSEMFAVPVKGRAVALISAFYWLSDLFTPFATTLIISTLTLGGAFLCHSLVCFITVVYIFLFIPETKGKTLHQVTQGLRNTSSRTRMFQNLEAVPCLSKNAWLQHKARQYRKVCHSAVESTAI